MAELATECKSAVLEDDASANFWRAIRNVEPFAALTDHAVWRVSVAPARGAEVGEAITRTVNAIWYLDWGGGLVWVAVPVREARG